MILNYSNESTAREALKDAAKLYEQTMYLKRVEYGNSDEFRILTESNVLDASHPSYIDKVLFDSSAIHIGENYYLHAYTYKFEALEAKKIFVRLYGRLSIEYLGLLMKFYTLPEYLSKKKTTPRGGDRFVNFKTGNLVFKEKWQSIKSLRDLIWPKHYVIIVKR